MKVLPLYKYYEMSGASVVYDEWVNNMKAVYSQRKREMPFEQWVKIITIKQHNKSNNEIKKLQAAGDINTEALKINKRYMGIPQKVIISFLIIGITIYGIIYLKKAKIIK